MRMTILIPDSLGENIKELAEERKKSVSSMAAEAFKHYINAEKRKALGNAVLEMIGRAKVDPDISNEIELGREDCHDRS